MSELKTEAREDVCPHCGRDINQQPLLRPKKKSAWRSCLTIGAILTGLLFVVVIGNAFISSTSGEGSAPRAPATATPTLADIQAAAVTIDYDDLARNTEDHVGKIAVFQGKVAQVFEGSDNRYALRVDTTRNDGWWRDTVWVNYQGARVLDNDIVELWGSVKGRRTYTAVLGNEITLPELDALHLVVTKEVGDD